MKSRKNNGQGDMVKLVNRISLHQEEVNEEARKRRQEEDRQLKKELRRLLGTGIWIAILAAATLATLIYKVWSRVND